MATTVSEEPVASVVMIQKYARSMSHQLRLVTVTWTQLFCLRITNGQKKDKTRAKQEKLSAVCKSKVKERQQGILIFCQFPRTW